MKRILITGGCGFLGHHVIDYILNNTDYNIISLDRIDATSTPERLKVLPCWKKEHERVKFIWHDLRAELNSYLEKTIGFVDYILHLAASTHVDRSIENPRAFIDDNIIGTFNLLEYIRHNRPYKFIYFSTDEVFGSANTEFFKEWDRYNSGNPYAATKAAAEELSLAYANTYGIPLIVTHTMNIFGERQHAEKFIPLVIRKILNDEIIFVHSDSAKLNSGVRSYIHARNVAQAVLFLFQHGQQREKYNIVGEQEITNLNLLLKIYTLMGKIGQPKYKLVDFHSSRPGHDLRYALNGDKLRRMGFKFESDFNKSLTDTVNWFLQNPTWL